MNNSYVIDKEKIQTIIDIYFNSIELNVPEESKQKVKNIVYSDIVLRCAKYGKSFPNGIKVNSDNYNPNYLIKPTNNIYSVEDLLLNRLMFNLRTIDFSGAIEGNGGEYVAGKKALNVNIKALSDAYNGSNTLKANPNFEQIKSRGIAKTIHHELGHSLKTVFKGGYKAPMGQGREQDENYIKLLESLKNTKYGNSIIDKSQLIDGETVLKNVGVSLATTVSNSTEKEDYMKQYKKIPGYDPHLDEMLNEDEALEICKCNEVQGRYTILSNGQPTDEYINEYNHTSGYRTFTGYGRCLRTLLGDRESFIAQYGSPGIIFEKFDKEYQDISKEVFKDDETPLTNVCKSLYVIKNSKDKKAFDALGLFMAKAYERKIENVLNGQYNSNDILNYINDIDSMLDRMSKSNSTELEHEKILNNLKSNLLDLYNKTNASSMNM